MTNEELRSICHGMVLSYSSLGYSVGEDLGF